MEFLKAFPKQHKVYYLTPEQPTFEKAYIKIRDLEKRVYPDDLVKQLPHTPTSHRYHHEWNKRKKATLRVLSYLKQQQPDLVLDLGCGNGWFTHQVATASGGQVLGADINKTELEQAARLFESNHCHFAYVDVFQANWPAEYFDQVIINSCIQYFADIPHLINQLFGLLKTDGVLHIIDSPIYQSSEVEGARERSQKYYESNGVGQMIKSYHHHSWKDFDAFPIQIKYRPDTLINKLKRKIDPNESPFPWIIITKEEYV